MKNISSICWGIVFIVVGVIFGLNALNITDIDIFFHGWWTLFIIVPCFFGVIHSKDRVGNLIGLFIGIFLLLCTRDILSFDLFFKLLFPFILVVLGLSFVFKDFFNRKVMEQVKKVSTGKNNEYMATFSSQNIGFQNEKFEGCEASAVFGGVKLDLRDSDIKKDCVINVSSIFGGIDIFVPKDVNVKVVSTCILGGVTDHTKKKNSDSKVTIYVNATCLFGGVEIKC